jgi:type IV pilus assembly protein PilP
MKKNLKISLIIVGLVCFVTSFLAPNTNAQKSDSLRGIRKNIIKKKIYPMPQVKGEISLTPQNSLKPKPKSDISRVSKVSVIKKSTPSSAREGRYMSANTMGFPEHDILPYSSTGKIDPFIPLIKATVIKKPNLPKPPDSDDHPKTELEKIDLSQLKLTAIVIRGSGGNRGLVQESSGKGHIIVLNTKIGTRGGKVVEIKKDRLIIEERGKDDFGRIIAQKRELAFPALMAGK